MNVAKFNSRLFDVDVEGFGYASLEDLFKANSEDTIYRVDGFFINTKSRLNDEAPVAVISAEGLEAMPATRKVKHDDGTEETVDASDKPGCYVNIPQHQLNEVKAILADPEAIECINAGEFGLSIRPYFQKTYAKDCYSARWENYVKNYTDFDY